MAGDYTKFSFKHKNNYSGVYKQQGRVSLDSDSNELSEIIDRRWRSETIDIIGKCVVPNSTPDGFRVILPVIPAVVGTFDIGIGRAYVDGIQVECHGLDPQQRYDAGLGEEQGTLPVPYNDQPYLPAPLPQSLTAPALPPITNRTDLIYLDVWQREVTVIEAPRLKEIALGGPDTTTRVQTAWQVKAITDVGDVSCPDVIPDWDDETRPSGGRLTTSTYVPPPDDNPCIISAAGGYRGIENRLYRVEIHTPGLPGTARFKWSRNNASIVASVTAINTDQITVESIGRDEILRFNVGDWVEITDDHLEFQSQVGHMDRITHIDEANRIITINNTSPVLSNLDPGDATRHTRVRRWDQRTGVDAEGLLPVPALATDKVAIEDGIQVSFNLDPAIVGSEFKIGDYWVFYARTADGSIEKLDNAPPRGIKHHYCRLALVTWGADVESTRVHDCRTFWPSANCCTIAVRPGEDIQAAIDSIPSEGGCICLLPGIHKIDKPLLIDGRKNLTITGIGAATKLVFQPYAAINAAQAMVYIVGASRDIEINGILIHADTQEHLIFIDEASKEIKIENCVLVNALYNADIASDCILLGECCKVSATRSRLVGFKGIVQAGSDILDSVRTSLSRLRPTPEREDEDEETTGDDVTTDDIKPIEVATLQGLRVIGNDIFFANTGTELQDVLSGHISENRLHAITITKLISFSKPPRQTNIDGVAVGVDVLEDYFYKKLEEDISSLSICPKLVVEVGDETVADNDDEDGMDEIPENTIGSYACLMEDFNIRENQITAMCGIVLEHCRLVRTEGNNIKAGERGISVNYGFETKIENNTIRITKQLDLSINQEKDDIFSSYRKRFKAGYLGISIRFVRGLKINRNNIIGQSAIGTWGGKWRKCNGFQANSLLRLFRIERLWRVVVELAWFLYRIFSMLTASAGGNGPTISKSEMEQRLFGWFTNLLSKNYIPYFIGKAEIADNQMRVSRFGVYCYEILTIGGLRICRNRISGFHSTGILVHHWFSVGLVDTYARVIRCLIEWALKFLTMLRDALEEFLDGTEPAEQPTTEPGITGIFAQGISWILILCSRYCGPEDTEEGGEEEAETPPSPARTLKDALDNFLDNIDPAWLDDLVNQSYDIDKNVIAGKGDGIWTDIDGTRITNNKVTIWPASTVPYETVIFGILLEQNSNGSVYYTPEVQGLAGSALELDRDMLFLFSIGAYNWMNGNHLNDPNFRQQFLSFLAELSNHIDPTSNLVTPITDIQEALNASPLDASRATTGWQNLIDVIMNELVGYGIAMRGANMVCRGNIVTSKADCIRSFFSFPSNSDIRRQSTVEIPAIGGIWQYSNLYSWFIDFIVLARDRDKNLYLYHIIMSLLALLALLLEKNRNMCIAQNEVERSLIHGIRTLGVMGSRELEIFDNVVKGASRYSICHRELFNDKIHGKIHRNILTKLEDSSVFANIINLLDDNFSALMWVENDEGTTLMSQNHGDDVVSSGEGSKSVYVNSAVVGIIANHIITIAEYAFEVRASNGLFTDNMTNKPNTVSPSSIVQGPNIVNL